MRFLPRLARRSRHTASLTIILLAGCSTQDTTTPLAHGDTDRAVTGTTRHDSVPDAGLRRRLERAASGLLYTSESDVPFTWFSAAGPFAAPLTEADIRTATGAAAGETVEIVTLERFFARHIERVDPADSVAVALVPRYRRLRETLRRAVPGIQVYRVGRIRIRCYLVGTDRDGNLVGLLTESIET